MSKSCDRHGRPAFTLIELLVVMTIIIVIAGLALLVTPIFGEQQKSALGATQVQSALFIAKQRAYRDRLTRGVAFLPDSTSPGGSWVRQLMYIEQPDDFSKGVIATAAGNAVTFSLPAGMDLSGPAPAPPIILPGDILVLTGINNPSTGVTDLHRILNVTSPNIVTLSDPITVTVPPNSPYKILRGVRALDGEPLVNLTQDVVVDFSQAPGQPAGVTLSQGAPTTTIPTSTGNVQAWYALFTPAGGLQLNGSSTGKVVFWVRDSIKDAVTDGQPTLITVYARSGAIAAYSVNMDSFGNPGPGGFWYFTQNGLNAGM